MSSLDSVFEKDEIKTIRVRLIKNNFLKYFKKKQSLIIGLC